MEMKREDAVDVLFIAMPFCDEYMPCLTLALFKSVLAWPCSSRCWRGRASKAVCSMNICIMPTVSVWKNTGASCRYVPLATVTTILPVKRFLARRLTAKRFLLLKIIYAGCRESIYRGKSLPAGSGRIPCTAWTCFRKPMRWRKRT